MKYPLTPDCSRAGAVPATQRTSSDPALFSAPDPTHYREYIYYHMTPPYLPSQEAQDFWRSAPDPYQNLKAGSGNETTRADTSLGYPTFSGRKGRSGH